MSGLDLNYSRPKLMNFAGDPDNNCSYLDFLALRLLPNRNKYLKNFDRTLLYTELPSGTDLSYKCGRFC
jgi:hypothetical protein